MGLIRWATIWIQSILFSVAFYASTACLFTVFFLMYAVGMRRHLHHMTRTWSHVILFWARLLADLRVEVIGKEHLPAGPVILAAKHQSDYDGIFLTAMLRDRNPATVMKAELMRIPVLGKFIREMDMLPIDRTAGEATHRFLSENAKRIFAEGRPIIIFPEGTLTAPGADNPTYKRGIAYLYEDLGATVVPVATNIGLCWGAGFRKYRGRVTYQFLPPIPPGLDKDAFLAQLQERIEAASRDLLGRYALLNNR